MPSRHPNSSFESNAALTVPNIISDKTSMEKSPAPILLGLHKITIFEGIKKILIRLIIMGAFLSMKINLEMNQMHQKKLMK